MVQRRVPVVGFIDINVSLHDFFQNLLMFDVVKANLKPTKILLCANIYSEMTSSIHISIPRFKVIGFSTGLIKEFH